MAAGAVAGRADMARPRQASRFTAAALGIALALLAGGCERSASGPAADATLLEPPRSIGAVQGRGPRSAYEGQMTSLQGVVTGNFVAGLDGFFMQDATGAEDGDAATSDGIFVEYARNRLPKVRRGDRVRVLGRVVERGEGEATLTSLAEAQVEVLGRGGVRVTPIDAAPDSADDWERWEGMWLRFNQPLTVTGNHGLLRAGELETALGKRLWVPTERHAPGANARALAMDNARRQLLLDDGRNQRYPDKRMLLAEDLSVERPLRAGSLLNGVEGVLDQRGGRWRLQLTEKLQQIEQAPRPVPPSLPAGLRLAHLDLNQLFNGNGRGGGFPSPGAASRVEYERQRNKLIAALQGLGADIVALTALENDGQGRGSSEAELVDALNAALGEAGDYQAVVLAEPADAGSAPTRVALLYRSQRVQVNGPAQALTDAAFGRGPWPLAQRFVTPEGTPLQVVALQLQGRACEGLGEADVAERDQDDGQGCWNPRRGAQVQAVDRWLREAGHGPLQSRSVLLGDFHAYRQEEPLRLLRSLGWRDALAELRPRPYTHVVDGRAGSLNHTLISPVLTPALLGAAAWAINSDESEAFDYRRQQRRPEWYQPDPYASSRHDPLLLVLKP